ncbi:uncharacterized protein LOC143209630 isoform X2 [Lasioglossum baleicum]|uniref:uncharacterized protein LOC143209630 isoform X2 n=1 Tax=Lasioglossum baleicum TaxID=434251 RepID=UPI003FCD95DB
MPPRTEYNRESPSVVVVYSYATDWAESLDIGIGSCYAVHLTRLKGREAKVYGHSSDRLYMLGSRFTKPKQETVANGGWEKGHRIYTATERR